MNDSVIIDLQARIKTLLFAQEKAIAHEDSDKVKAYSYAIAQLSKAVYYGEKED